MALTRLQQLCLRQETYEGLYTDPFSATYANYLAVDPQMTFEVETYQRNVARESFTPLSPLAGAVLGQCTFGLEVASRGTAINTFPNFDIPLRSCGFRREVLTRVTIGAIGGSGPAFLHGETITQGANTATVVGTTWNGEAYLYYANSNGLGGPAAFTPGGGTITGSTSGATATPSQVDGNWAHGYWPISQPLHNLTFSLALTSGTIAAGDVIRGVTSGAIAVAAYPTTTALGTLTTVPVRRVLGTFASGESVTVNGGSPLATALSSAPTNQWYSTVDGVPISAKLPVSSTLSIGLCRDGVRESLSNCRGTVSISGNIGEPMIMNFTFSGVKNAVADGGNLTGISYTDRLPPVLLGATMKVADTDIITSGAEKTLCISSFGVDMANDIQYRRCMNAATGVDGVYLNGRTPTGTIDPELTPEADFAYMADFFSAKACRLKIDVGSTTGDKFRIKLHNMALNSVGQGDRNGVLIRDVGFALHSGSGTSVSGDNEMCIIWSPNAVF